MSSTNDEREGPCAVLAFSGPSFDPRSVERFFSMPQKFVRRAGETSLSPGGVRIRAPLGYCRYSTLGLIRSSAISDHVAFLLSQFEEHQTQVIGLVRAQRANCEITCFPIYLNHDREFFAEVSPDVLARAERLGLPVVNLELGRVTFVDDRP